MKIDQYHPVFGKEETKAVNKYMQEVRWLTESIYTRQLEDEICHFLGVKFCHMMPNGTISLVIALLALGVQKNDFVIVPALTMCATARAVQLIGAIPIYVDVEPGTGCMSLEKLKNSQYPKDTKALIYVSLNGRSGDILDLKKWCKRKGYYLIEDAAQSMGSMHNGKYLGTWGDIGCFSLSTQKIISTGQGGYLVTDDKELSNKISRIKDFGREDDPDEYKSYGINAKYTDLQAVIGIEQMKKLPDRIKRKKEIIARYHENIGLPMKQKDGEVLWMIDFAQPEDRPGFMDDLEYAGIGTRQMYPVLPQDTENYPNSSRLSRELLWLPSSIDIKDEEIDYVCDKIKEHEGGI